MLSVDADILWRLAPPQGKTRAARQREIIDGRGASFAAALGSRAIDTIAMALDGAFIRAADHAREPAALTVAGKP